MYQFRPPMGCADFGYFLIHRMVQRASTIRKNQLPCLDLDTSYFSTCRMLPSGHVSYNVTIHVIQIIRTLLVYTQQQIEASLQLYV